MMLSPVSNVRFCGEVGATNNDNILTREGAFAKPAEPDKFEKAEAQEPKKSNKGKIALGVIAGAVAIAAALVGLNKGGILKTLSPEALADAKFLDKAGHYISKAGEQIAKYTYDPIVNFCKTKFGSGAADLAE